MLRDLSLSQRIRLLAPILALTIGMLGFATEPSATRPDLILVSIDTLRPDHLGCYGYPRDTSPEIDRLAETAVRFETAIAQAPSTLPSHASILSSMLPSQHGALYSRNQGLADEIFTVTEALRDAGYRTSAFTGGGQMAPEFNLNQGFEVYLSEHGTLPEKVEHAIEWLKKLPSNEPAFIFLHTYDVHHAYEPDAKTMARFDSGYEGKLPDRIEVDLLKRINGHRGMEPLEIDAADLQHIINAYDAEIAEMDVGIGELIDKLKRIGRYQNTVVIITSDHGEEFGEHGRVGWHSHNLYDHQLKVPLILRLPNDKYAGTVVRPQVRGIDLAPTLLELAGVEAPPSFQGQSLLLRLGPDADTEHWLARSERDGKKDPLDVSLRDGRFKWYKGRLFDLQEDPLEQHDRSDLHPEVAARLDTELKKKIPPMITSARELMLEKETRRRLKELGYAD